jgi:hypothetical protein
MRAVEAALAWHVVVNCNAIPLRVGFHVLPNILNVARHLMPKNGRRHPQAMKLLQIRSADSACSHLDKDLSPANLREFKIGDF